MQRLQLITESLNNVDFGKYVIFTISASKTENLTLTQSYAQSYLLFCIVTYPDSNNRYNDNRNFISVLCTLETHHYWNYAFKKLIKTNYLCQVTLAKI